MFGKMTFGIEMFEVMIFENQEKNLWEHEREPSTNSTHMGFQHQDWNPGHVGGRRVNSPMRQAWELFTEKILKAL